MVTLVILDGFGHAPPGPGNAIHLADTPHWDRIWNGCPHTLLEACGEAVGLPAGVMGNSEVGHLNLGAGRVVFQPLVLINRSISNREFAANPVLSKAMEAGRPKGRIHLMGLVSDGGVHSHMDHLLALIEMARAHQVSPVVHAFLDGRDTPPRSALPFLERLEEPLTLADGRFGTIMGRYFAMDRDKRWHRVERAYRALFGQAGFVAPTAPRALEEAYQRGENDEFVQPTRIGPAGGVLEEGDPCVFFNFRADRARELSAALSRDRFLAFDRQGNPRIGLATMMEYDPALGLPHAYSKDRPRYTLGELVAKAGQRQFRCAETEKYAHVTYFFNGGREEPFQGEERSLIPSPRVATYDLKPEMSAPGVTRATTEAIDSGRFALTVVNFANADMVGHTGKLKPAIRAVETVDDCLGHILKAATRRNEPCLVTSDHGNSDCVITPEGRPHTYHTLNPVPCVLLAPWDPWRKYGLRQPEARAARRPSHSRRRSQPPCLADVAPTLLELLGLEQPQEMTGRSLLVG